MYTRRLVFDSHEPAEEVALYNDESGTNSIILQRTADATFRNYDLILDLHAFSWRNLDLFLLAIGHIGVLHQFGQLGGFFQAKGDGPVV